MGGCVGGLIIYIHRNIKNTNQPNLLCVCARVCVCVRCVCVRCVCARVCVCEVSAVN